MSDSHYNNTIAAVSTANAAGGIGIVRISGPQARRTAEAVFHSKKGSVLTAPGYTALYGRVYDGDRLIDEAIALCFAAPASYTGEDVVELSCHGGTFVVREVLRAVLAAGARPAEAGEFTKRAFLNGKISLTQAEAVMDIISADGRAAAAAATAAHEGALWRETGEITDSLTEIAAWLAAWSDYPEDDIVPVDTETLSGRLNAVKDRLDRLISTYKTGRILKNGISTVIVGRPNVGKSTLMNLITGSDNSIVTDIPGTTRDVVTAPAMLGGIQLSLNDTAGIRETGDTVEKIGVERAKRALESAELILAVFDRSSQLDDDDLELLKLCKNRPALAIINKSDLPSVLDEKVILSYINSAVEISAKSFDSKQKLTEAVTALVGIEHIDSSAAIIANERQLDCARRAQDALCDCIFDVNAGITLDAVSVTLDTALSALLELNGKRITRSVADKVFEKFCVGK